MGVCADMGQLANKNEQIRKILSCNDPDQCGQQHGKEIEIAANNKSSFKASMLIKIAFVKWRDRCVPWKELKRIVNALGMFNGLLSRTQ